MLDTLGISLPKVIFTIINFTVLILVLAKFLYKPFVEILQTRKESIQSAIENADLVNRKADEKMANYDHKIAKLESEGRDIIKAARQRADAQASEIIKQANEKANDILEQARKEIMREQAQALIDMKKQIGVLALLTAEKIMEKDIESNGQDQIVEQVLKEAGASEWQN